MFSPPLVVSELKLAPNGSSGHRFREHLKAFVLLFLGTKFIFF